MLCYKKLDRESNLNLNLQHFLIKLVSHVVIIMKQCVYLRYHGDVSLMERITLESRARSV
jgi:hypothetical protein